MSRSEERRDALERATHKLQTQGLEAAVDAAIYILKDASTPANARATTLSSVLRANGLFAEKSAETTKELHEMSMAELRANGDRLERDLQDMLRRIADGENEDVFQ